MCTSYAAVSLAFASEDDASVSLATSSPSTHLPDPFPFAQPDPSPTPTDMLHEPHDDGPTTMREVLASQALINELTERAFSALAKQVRALQAENMALRDRLEALEARGRRASAARGP